MGRELGGLPFTMPPLCMRPLPPQYLSHGYSAEELAQRFEAITALGPSVNEPQLKVDVRRRRRPPPPPRVDALLPSAAPWLRALPLHAAYDAAGAALLRRAQPLRCCSAQAAPPGLPCLCR